MFWFANHRLTKSFFLAIAALGLVLTLGWSQPANALTARHYTDLEFAPLSEIQIPDFERYELPNGLVVYLMEKHDLPLVTGSATFKTGEFMEPDGKAGLAGIMGEAMRSGGTVSYTPDELNQFLYHFRRGRRTARADQCRHPRGRCQDVRARPPLRRCVRGMRHGAHHVLRARGSPPGPGRTGQHPLACVSVHPVAISTATRVPGTH